MIESLWKIGRAITEVSVPDAMGGLAVALGLALLGSYGCLLARRRASDPLPGFCGLILLISLGSMAFGFGLSKTRAGRTEGSFADVGSRSRFFVMPQPIGRRLIDDADRDGDERLTPEEAARFVRGADRTGKGWVDATEIDMARRPWVVPDPIPDFQADSDQSGHFPSGD